jgi:hypothetical protein
MGFDHVTVAQNGRNCSDEEKRKPERIDVLLEDLRSKRDLICDRLSCAIPDASVRECQILQQLPISATELNAVFAIGA